MVSAAKSVIVFNGANFETLLIAAGFAPGKNYFPRHSISISIHLHSIFRSQKEHEANTHNSKSIFVNPWNG